jgi:hypothetical protein
MDEIGRPQPKLDCDYEGGMAVCAGDVRVNDGFFDVTLSLCVNNVVRGAWGAALLNLELYDLHVRPLVARISAKQKMLGGTARAVVSEASEFLAEKTSRSRSPHWDVLLRWASRAEPPACGPSRPD